MHQIESQVLDIPFKGLRLWVFKPAAQHVDGLVDRPYADVACVLILHNMLLSAQISKVCFSLGSFVCYSCWHACYYRTSQSVEVGDVIWKSAAWHYLDNPVEHSFKTCSQASQQTDKLLSEDSGAGKLLNFGFRVWRMGSARVQRTGSLLPTYHWLTQARYLIVYELHAFRQGLFAQPGAVQNTFSLIEGPPQGILYLPLHQHWRVTSLETAYCNSANKSRSRTYTGREGFLQLGAAEQMNKSTNDWYWLWKSANILRHR